ncbi:MAG: glycosyltransferase family 4 protein, partial [bacterium]
SERHTQLAELLQVTKIGIWGGHLWEQISLPIYLRKQKNPPLLNFVNTGPISYENQITVIHDLSFVRYPASFSKQFCFYYSKIIPRIIARSKKIITVSKFTRDEIIKIFGVHKNKIAVVYNFLSEKLLRLSKEDYGNENKYGDYVLTVSSLNPRKNLKRILQAFNLAKLKNAKLLIVGENRRIFRREDLSQHLNDNVIFTGFVEDEELVRLYKNAKLFLYPSLYEGFGIPPIEAMLCGCPVIVSNVSSMPEICGDAAFYVNPLDPNEIKDAVLEVYHNKDLRENLVRKGLKVVNQFNFDRSLKALYDEAKLFVRGS